MTSIESGSRVAVPLEWLFTATGMNVIAGTVGGAAGTVAGHPFDTIKVRLQCQRVATVSSKLSANTVAVPSTTTKNYSGTFNAFGRIAREEGVRGLFRGMASPLVGVATVNALLFGVYGGLIDWQRRLAGNAEPTMTQVFVAGAGSGLINSVVSAPSELVKIQMQNQRTGRRPRRGESFGKTSSGTTGAMSPMQCLREIVTTHGWRGCFRGLGATVLRETPSYGVYFAVFDGLQRHSVIDASRDWQLMLAGGISGVAGWLSTYPFDVIKTHIQAQPLGRPGPGLSFRQAFAELAAENAPWHRTFFRGVGPTVVRAFPTNAVIFWAYAYTMRNMERLGRMDEPADDRDKVA